MGRKKLHRTKDELRRMNRERQARFYQKHRMEINKNRMEQYYKKIRKNVPKV